MVWQIEKTTKRCQDCNATIAVSQHYFSALFLNSTPPDQSQPPVVTEGSPVGAGDSRPIGEPVERLLRPAHEGEARLWRRDFCANCWERRTAAGEEPPFSFWQTVIDPPAEPPKTPREVLLNFFDNLFVDATAVSVHTETEGSPAVGAPQAQAVPDTRLKLQVKYLFALIMMRKKLLRLKSPLTRDNARYLVLERFAKPQRSPDNFGGDSKSYEVQEVNISDEELTSLRQEFSQLFEFRI
jgi:hypothetical protein